MNSNSCSNNTPATPIPLEQPCHPCTSCNKCACDCTCDAPNYCNEGCVLPVYFDCTIYKGDPIVVNGVTIEDGDNLTKLIEALGGVVEEDEGDNNLMMSVAPEEDSSDIDVNASINALADRVTMVEERLVSEDDNLQEQISNITSLSDLAITSDVLEGDLDGSNLNLNLNNEGLLNALIEYITSSEEATSRFGQLISYINNPANFINAPYQVSVIPSITTALVQWTDIPEASTYAVYRRAYASGTFENVGVTPSLGLTVSGLAPETLFEFYVVSIDASGNRSLPSAIKTAQTLSNNP